MTVIKDIISTIKGDHPVEDLRVCLKQTAVHSRKLGLVTTMSPRKCTQRLADAKPRPKLSRTSALELTKLVGSEDLVLSSIGLAAVNSLLDTSGLELAKGRAFDLIVELSAGGAATVIGHFPFVERLKPLVKSLYVLELDPHGDDMHASEAKNVIPKSDVVVITATALINSTFEDLLELSNGKKVIILGPSTPISVVFFDHGVTAVCGSIVTDAALAMQGVNEAVPFHRMQGIEPVILRNT